MTNLQTDARTERIVKSQQARRDQADAVEQLAEPLDLVAAAIELIGERELRAHTDFAAGYNRALSDMRGYLGAVLRSHLDDVGPSTQPTDRAVLRRARRLATIRRERADGGAP